jgi:hypothetical protein
MGKLLMVIMVTDGGMGIRVAVPVGVGGNGVAVGAGVADGKGEGTAVFVGVSEGIRVATAVGVSVGSTMTTAGRAVGSAWEMLGWGSSRLLRKPLFQRNVRKMTAVITTPVTPINP